MPTQGCLRWTSDKENFKWLCIVFSIILLLYNLGLGQSFLYHQFMSGDGITLITIISASRSYVPLSTNRMFKLSDLGIMIAYLHYFDRELKLWWKKKHVPVPFYHFDEFDCEITIQKFFPNHERHSGLWTHNNKVAQRKDMYVSSFIDWLWFIKSRASVLKIRIN